MGSGAHNSTGTGVHEPVCTGQCSVHARAVPRASAACRGCVAALAGTATAGRVMLPWAAGAHWGVAQPLTKVAQLDDVACGHGSTGTNK